MTLVKICGLTTPETVDAAIEAGADFLGFMLYPRSPRALTAEQAAPLIERARGRARTVAVVVDPDDALVEAVAALGPDLIQLHGRETPARVTAVRRATGSPVIKVVAVGCTADVAAASAYAVEHVMFETKPPVGADRPGGHGAVFDWTLLSDLSSQPERSGEPGPRGRGAPRDPRPLSDGVPDRASRVRDDNGVWFLAGGLTPENVAEAVRVTRAPAVDVSSGVESAPGVKDPALIAAFIRAAKAAPDMP